MTNKNLAHQAAAAARNGDYENASVLYTQAAMEADKSALTSPARAKALWAKADHYERMYQLSREGGA